MVDLFVKFDVSFFSVVLLIVLLVSMHIRRDFVSYSTKLFKRMIYINIAMLLLEILSWQFDMKPGVFNWYANYASNMIFAWLTTSITCAWASYVDYRMFGSIERLRKRWFYIQPMIGNTILVIVNMFVPVVFSVSPENVYAREPMMWLIVLFNSLCLIYIAQLAYKNRTRIQKEIIFVILIFVCMPAVVAGLQVLIYGVFIMWPTMAIALVITYIFLETISTSRDYLTGLYSRNRVDEYIDYMLSMKKSLGVIMIDLDMFKNINDTYGHHCGDEALRIFARVLKNVFSEERMVARYAGDEFIVVTKLFDNAKLKTYENKLKNMLSDIKLEHTLPYDICFSMGTAQKMIKHYPMSRYYKKRIRKCMPVNRRIGERIPKC